MRRRAAADPLNHTICGTLSRSGILIAINELSDDEPPLLSNDYDQRQTREPIEHIQRRELSTAPPCLLINEEAAVNENTAAANVGRIDQSRTYALNPPTTRRSPSSSDPRRCGARPYPMADRPDHPWEVYRLGRPRG